MLLAGFISKGIIVLSLIYKRCQKVVGERFKRRTYESVENKDGRNRNGMENIVAQ